MWSVASGAGWYSKPRVARAVSLRLVRALSREPSIEGEVVARLVGARLLLGQLHQAVVEEAGGADPEPLRGHPVGAEGLVEEDQVVDRLLRGPDAAGGLEADPAAGLPVEVADRLHHHQRDGWSGGGVDLSGRGLDEVGSGGHR